MNASSRIAGNVKYDAGELFDAEAMPDALSIPALYTMFSDAAAASKQERKLTLHGLSHLIMRTRALTKPELPWIKGAKFGDLKTEKGSLRHDKNIVAVTCIEMDYDAGLITLDEMAAKFAKARVGCLLSTSPGATATRHRYRLHAPLSQPCTVAERARLAGCLNGVAGGVFAAESFTASQAFYYGGIEGNAAHRTRLVPGMPVDLMPWLERHAIGKPAKSAKPGELTPATGGPVDEPECLALIESGQSYTQPTAALLGKWARKGKMSVETAVTRLTEAMQKVPKEKQDARWKARLDDIRRHALSIFSREETARAQRSASDTEFKLSNAFVARYRDRLRYFYPGESWYQFEPAGWAKIPTPAVVNMAVKLIEELRPGDHKTNKRAVASSVENLARGYDGILISADEFWDLQKTLLATPGGTIDLETGRLRPTRPADYSTKVTSASIPAGYDPDLAGSADLLCPRWVQFMAEVCQCDAGKVRFLRQYLGYSLSGLTDEHKFVFVYGQGSNGKSVFMNVALKVIGHYAMNAAPDVFMASGYDRHSEEIWRLNGARFVCASETESGRRWNEQRLKRCVAGDFETAREMRQNSIQFRYQCKLLFTGNNKPAITNLDDALKRRIVMVHFNHVPPVKDMQLEAKLLAEADGILAWMVDGFLDWRENGLVVPASVARETNDYFESQDTFELWLEDRCERDPAASTSAADLWDSYSNFIRLEHPQRVQSMLSKKSTFPERLKKSGFVTVRKMTGPLYIGLRLLVDGEAKDFGSDGTL